MISFDLDCRLRNLPAPVAEYRFHETRKWRFDHAWPDRKLALEIDGGVWQNGGGRHNRRMRERRLLHRLAPPRNKFIPPSAGVTVAMFRSWR